MSTTDPAPPRRARHLMDPDHPRPPTTRRAGAMSTERVQQWVASALVITTLAHLAAGIVIAALYLDDARTAEQLVLVVIAGIFGVISIAVARAIHGKPLLTPWLLVGLLPTVIGTYLVLVP